MDKALQHLLAAETAERRLPGLHNQIGLVFLRMRRSLVSCCFNLRNDGQIMYCADRSFCLPREYHKSMHN